MKILRQVAPGRYEGDGIIIVKRHLFGEPWQVYAAAPDNKPVSVSETSHDGLVVHERVGGYGSLDNALFHCNAEVVKHSRRRSA